MIVRTDATPRHPPSSQPRATRWGSLDALRGVALVMMIAHHFAKWTGGRVGERFVGYPDLLVTDLAAPAFAVGVGAAAFLVGQHVRPAGGPGAGSIDGTRAGRALWRWSQVMLLGLAIDLAVGGGIDGGGVLPTLAVLGTIVTAASAAGVTRPTAWWVVALVCVLGAVPATAGSPTGFLPELWGGPFSIVVYGTFAAAGAALAATAHPAGEEHLPLVRAAVAVVAVSALSAALVPDLVAPEGLWPPARYPGDLAFTTWGLAATLLIWATLRWLVPKMGAVGDGLMRAGQRTLLMFGVHYTLKVVLTRTGHLGELDTWRWGLVMWAAVAVMTLAAMVPSPARRAARRRPPTSAPADERSI